MSLSSNSTRVAMGDSNCMVIKRKCIQVDLLKSLKDLVSLSSDSADSQSIITCACKAAKRIRIPNRSLRNQFYGKQYLACIQVFSELEYD